MARIAINGFGRIGRTAFKIALQHPEIEVVAINDLTDAKTLAHLLKYDSNYGTYAKSVGHDAQNIIVDGKKFRVYSEKEPSKLPWKDLNVDIVLECTGKFTDANDARQHITAGAKGVIISAPAKNAHTFVLGVNQTEFGKQDVISNASCTTNCISPVIHVLHSKFGVEKAMMTTVHAYTSDQKLHDAPHKDLRRARAAAENIVPTTTGAALATTEVIPELKGKFDGIAIRVPVKTVSLSDVTALLKKNVSKEDVNNAFKEASASYLKGILGVTAEPLVSSDFIGDTRSAIIDLEFTQVVGGNMVKVLAWYDNEWGYSVRLVEQAVAVTKSLK